jgi:hypothetical protein
VLVSSSAPYRAEQQSDSVCTAPAHALAAGGNGDGELDHPHLLEVHAQPVGIHVATARARSAQWAASSLEKNSSAVRVLVCCSPERSIPCRARYKRASVATKNASDGRHLVESSKMRAPSG